MFKWTVTVMIRSCIFYLLLSAVNSSEVGEYDKEKIFDFFSSKINQVNDNSISWLSQIDFIHLLDKVHHSSPSQRLLQLDGCLGSQYCLVLDPRWSISPGSKSPDDVQPPVLHHLGSSTLHQKSWLRCHLHHLLLHFCSWAPRNRCGKTV